MITNFQPNKARPVPYVDIFRKHVSVTLKQPQTWPKVQSAFARMQQLRQSFDWDVITKSEQFNNPRMRTIQDNVEEYLRYCIFMSTKFKFGSGKQAVKGFNVDWMMAWTGSKQKSNQIVFEIANMLYNYLILNFNQAGMYLKKGFSKQEYKGALEKLRYAKWAANELLKIQPELEKSMKVPFEMRADSLQFLLGFTEGLSYLCFFYMFEDGSNPAVTGENLASLEKEIAKWFFVCRQSLSSNKKLRKLMKPFKEDILEFYYTNLFNCYIRTIHNLGIQHEAQKTKGFIGIQYGYMKEVEAMITQMKREDKFPSRNALLARFQKDVKPMMNPTEQKIKQVFKCPVPHAKDLRYIKRITTKVTPIEPKNVRIPPPEAPYFSSFFSEKLEGVRSSINLFISNKKQHIQKSFADLSEKIREIYSINNVQALANCANLQNMVLNDDFKTQLKVFKQVNGGAQAYHQINQNLDLYSQMINNVMQSSDQVVQAEIQNDQAVKQSSGNQNAITGFADANKAELNQLKRKFLNIKNSKTI